MPRKSALILTIPELMSMTMDYDRWYIDHNGQFIPSVQKRFQFSARNFVKRWRLCGLLAIRQAHEAIAEMRDAMESYRKMSESFLSENEKDALYDRIDKALATFHKYNDRLIQIEQIIREGK